MGFLRFLRQTVFEKKRKFSNKKIKGKNDLCSDLTHGFQVLYLRSHLKKIWYFYIFPITKMDKVCDKTVTT